MNFQNTPPSQRGFTALELIIVLIIGFSIIGLSAGKMSDMMSSSKAVRALDSIFSLSNAIAELNLAANSNGVNIKNAMVDAGTLPKSLRVRGDDLINEWGKTIVLATDAGGLLSITYPGMNKVACNKLARELGTIFKVSIQGQRPPATPLAAGASVQAISLACNIAEPIALILEDLASVAQQPLQQ